MVTIDGVSYDNSTREHLTKETMKNILEEVLANRELHLMKPIEQQALFLAGKLSQENVELRERLDLVIAENNELRNRFKALPVPPEEITIELERKESELTVLVKDNKELEKKLGVEVECTRIARESERRLNAQVREREAVISELEESIKEVFLEEARARADLDASWRSAMDELKAKLEEEEVAQAQLKAEWVKTLGALKEAQRPWWKKVLKI